jgi:lipopolysaccharide export system permease protein
MLVFVVTLLAVPLSRVNPRQGRFLKLLPAILLYMAYLTMLISVRGALEKGKCRSPWACGGSTACSC